LPSLTILAGFPSDPIPKPVSTGRGYAYFQVMDSAFDWHGARALLEWQLELGVTEAIGDAPLNRYEMAAETAPSPAFPPAASPPERKAKGATTGDPVATARVAAQRAHDLSALNAAVAEYTHCELKKGARSTVFADGNPAARVMIIGEAPGRDEDIQGKPFVGRAGQLLDKMLAAIGLARDAGDAAKSVYITNILPWRPPQNRDPLPEEIAMLRPFVERHVELVDPGIIVLMGNISCQAMLGRRGITRLRGQWAQVLDRPALPMFHPAYLLRNPHAKREAWADLLELRTRLRAGE
jgi:uracil-DNA glycosylase family 4